MELSFRDFLIVYKFELISKFWKLTKKKYIFIACYFWNHVAWTEYVDFQYKGFKNHLSIVFDIFCIFTWHFCYPFQWNSSVSTQKRGLPNIYLMMVRSSGCLWVEKSITLASFHLSNRLCIWILLFGYGWLCACHAEWMVKKLTLNRIEAATLISHTHIFLPTSNSI